MMKTHTGSRLPRVAATASLGLFAALGCSDDDPASVNPVTGIAKTTSTDNQQADAGTQVTISPEVTLTRANGDWAVGETVTFAVTGGGGSITGAVATTDVRGKARVNTWTLGPQASPPPNTLSATAPGGLEVTFSALGVPGPATSLIIADGDEQTGTVRDTLNVRPRVRAVDQFGNGVQGISVEWRVTLGGGSVVGQASTITEPDGYVAVGQWRLGPTPGPNMLEAEAPGFPVVEFEATAVP